MKDNPFALTKQCSSCPWRVDVDPAREIPGYSPDKHEGLFTCAERGVIMACHKSPEGEDFACVGWLAHELGPGNNIPLRIKASHANLGRLELQGEQHACIEHTLK